MKKIPNFILVALCFCFGCINKERTIVIDSNVKATGNIGPDTVYEGKISFYNIHSNKLLSTANYSNGVINGESIEYYDNGVISSRLNYEQGKKNGIVSLYSKAGELENEYFTYYDLKVGENVHYRNGVTSSYSFYSFDNKRLFFINYDSVASNPITKIQDGFFFFTVRNFHLINNSNNQIEIFLYTPNPPNYDFQYSLVVVDEKFTLKKEIEKFPRSNRWTIFSNEVQKGINEKLALRLEIDDPNMPEKIVMYKGIE